MPTAAQKEKTSDFIYIVFEKKLVRMPLKMLLPFPSMQKNHFYDSQKNRLGDFLCAGPCPCVCARPCFCAFFFAEGKNQEVSP